MSEITRYPRYRVIAGLEQDLHGMMTRPDGFVYEEAEVAIVRAAAEITRLTADIALTAEAFIATDEDGMQVATDAECKQWSEALRRYAELARGRDGT